MPRSGGPVAISPEHTKPEDPPRGRARTLLGVPSLPTRSAPVEEPNTDNATRVEASPFDGATAQTPRLEPVPAPLEETTSPSERLDVDAGEATTTSVRLGRPDRPPSEDDLTNVRDEAMTRGGDDGPTDVHRALPPARPAPARPTTRRSEDGRATPAHGARTHQPPPAPLPPPPSGGPKTPRVDVLEAVTNVRTSLPPARAQDLGAEGPELLAPAGAGTADDLVGDMPPIPGPGILPSVKYLIPLARAIWARHNAQKSLRVRLHSDQRLVDDTLHDLGRAAWQEPNRPSELRAELERADEDDARRRNEEKEVAHLDMSISGERERHLDDEGKRTQAIAAREVEIARVAEDLAEKQRAQKAEEKTLREATARHGAAEKRVQALIAKAARAELTPPEKGGGPNAAANHREQAAAAQREADNLRPERDAAEERARDLDAPIAALTGTLSDERAKLVEQKTALEVARRDHQAALASLEAKKAEHDGARAIAEKSIRLRLVSTGTLLSLHRMDSPKLLPIYGRLDELQATAAAREARISHLEAERHSYDKPALQRGLIAVGAATGTFVVLLVVVLVLLAR